MMHAFMLLRRGLILSTVTGPCDNDSELILPCLYYDEYQAEVRRALIYLYTSL
jgi:hypothetical protein